MPSDGRVLVTWELPDEPEQATRIVVDLVAPLRPFGSSSTPPKGIAAEEPMPEQRGRRLSEAALRVIDKKPREQTDTAVEMVDLRER
jgi:hypothetical protein